MNNPSARRLIARVLTPLGGLGAATLVNLESTAAARTHGRAT
ncbi:hypothetical protein [Streptomyces vinaceus]